MLKPPNSSPEDYFAKQGYDILDQIAGIIANREVACLGEIHSAIENKFGAEGIYDRFVGPLVDEIQIALDLNE